MKHHSGSLPAGIIVLFGVLIAVLVLTASASAGPIQKKKERLKAIQAKLESVGYQSEIAVEKYNQATAELETVRAKIAENQRQLEIARQNLATANTMLQDRARSIYKSEDPGIIDVIFESDTFDELVSQMDLMKRLNESDVDAVHAIEAYRRDIKDRRVKLEADQKVSVKLVAEREAQKNQLIAYEDRLQTMTGKLKKQIKQLKAQERLRMQLALQGYSGPIPKYDPNAPGRPEVVAIAKQFFGVPYVWGGASPSGFDCSGLTMYCYAQIGIQLYHGATMQQRASSPVPLSELQMGDLIFFGGASFSHHVAIFVGGSTCIEAPHSGDVVRYGTWTGRDAWIGGRF